jgi:hypothetical protein
MNTLVEIYRHVGERVRVDLQRKEWELVQPEYIHLINQVLLPYLRVVLDF